MSETLNNFINKNNERAAEYLKILEDMLNSGNYIYAEHTLASMYGFIEKNGYISDSQITAINNIKKKPKRYGRW